jgi:hypothetical protein
MHFYYDQRIRNEGYDIEWMMERAGLVAGGVTASIELRPEPDGDSTAAPSVVPATAAMETPPESAETTPAHAGVAAEATEQEQSAASESTVVTDAPQPESRVQE